MRRLALTFLAAAAGCCPTSGVISFPTSAGVPTAGQGGTATSGVASGGTGSSATGASNGTGATGAATAAGSSGGSTSTGATSATGGTGTTATTGAGSSGGTGQASGSAGSSGATSFTTLTVFAGQLGGQGYADGSATDARFWAADGVVADGAGHVFVADTGGNTIREIDLATGAVTTLAGLAAIYGSADGTGPAARFEEPYGLTYDGAGNLFVADTINDTIRQVVVATGAVTTIAGAAGARGSADGAGTAATFWYPEGIASDGAGHLFVSDTNNCTIREIDLTNGAAVTTLAGTAGSCTYADGTGAAASFNLPNGLAYDGTANLYVADSGNQVIRKIVVSTGVVTTLAGTEGVTGSADGTGTAASFDTPNGVAWDGAGNLLVADSDNSTIRSVVATSGVVTTIAGSAQLQGFADGTGTAATFHFPWGVGADGAGHAYVADGYNDTVRQIVEATAAVTTVAGVPGQQGSADGTSAATFNAPHGVTSDGAGNLYVADTGNCTIRQVAVASGAVSTLAGSPGQEGHADGASAGFFLPWAVAWGGGSTLYVADTFNNTIRAVDVSTKAVSTLAGTPGTGSEVDGSGPDAGFSSPAGLAYDGAGNLYVADSLGETIRQVAVATATVTTIAGEAGVVGSTDGTGPAALFSGPVGLALDGAGHLFVSDVGNSTVREIDLASGAVTTVLGVPREAAVVPGPAPAEINWPVGLAFVAANGPALFIADSNENALLVAR